MEKTRYMSLVSNTFHGTTHREESVRRSGESLMLEKQQHSLLIVGTSGTTIDVSASRAWLGIACFVTLCA